MRQSSKWLYAIPLMVSASTLCGHGAWAADADPTTQPSSTSSGGVARAAVAQVQEVIVTAQKRAENIQNVGMSINAVTGDQLVERGALDPSQLTRVVPGFQYNANAFGTPVYSIRGVGFQDSTLAASPTVTVYVDQVPIPFSAETIGASLDPERLEVLKGPQGTLYGENATGGALNFIAAKPTTTFQAGVDASYGRFSTADVSGFVSGPLGDTLTARLSGRALEGGNWQKSYTTGATLGQQNLLEGRLLLDWKPIERLRLSLNLNIWQDRSDSPAPQLTSIVGLGANAALLPALVNYPLAPRNARAADWDQGESYARNNIFYMGSLRADYDVASDITFSLINSIQRYTRHQPIDGDGTSLQDIFLDSHGSIDTIYEEARLAGNFAHRGHWIVGANYESDNVYDAFYESFADSTSRSIFGLPLSGTGNFTQQHAETYAVYGSGDYDLTRTLNLQGGVRYTQANRGFSGCSFDTTGQAAAIFDLLQQVLKDGSYVPIAKGGCINLNAAADPALATGRLDQNNVSWRVGLNWKVTPDTLLYGNVSQGYKAGSYPTLSASVTSQFVPVVQENLIAYEAGFKTTLIDHTLQLNGAGFYYDYRDKQILGRVSDPIFGPLLTLVNIPKSHIVGGELQMEWRPMAGLTITPDVTYVYSRVDGHFVNYDQFGVLRDFTGESFPYTPKYQATVDANYTFPIRDGLAGFVQGDLSYQSRTNGALGEAAILDIKPYALLDLRAGVQSPSGDWRFSVWGRNVTNVYYWTTSIRDNDTTNRYAGLPATYGVSIDYRFR